MLTVGSQFKIKDSQMADLEIVATFSGLENAFLESDFEDRLKEDLEKLHDEIMIMRRNVVELTFNNQPA